MSDNNSQKEKMSDDDKKVFRSILKEIEDIGMTEIT